MVCVDIQDKMLARLRKRADRSRVGKQIEVRLVPHDGIHVPDLNGKVDVVVLFYVVHEVPDTARLWREIFAAMKAGGVVLFAEPTHHVTEEEFAASLKQAEAAGFQVAERSTIKMGHSAVLRR